MKRKPSKKVGWKKKNITEAKPNIQQYKLFF